jgi:hypothetical protein
LNYLQLCQRTAQYSGTIDGTAPTAVTGQVGRLAILVNMVNSAWSDIQGEHLDSWRWLRSGFTGTLSAGTKRYTAGSFSLTRFSRWIEEFGSLSMYATATGVSDEKALEFIDYQLWRRTYDRGTPQPQRPRQVAISPTEELCFGAVPDAGYTVLGEYMKGKQTLADDADIPECPADYHEVIVWKALILLNWFDEASQLTFGQCQQFYFERLDALRRSQLPRTVIGQEPLA